jgi:CubicO group peptidase (beta-lactamase class C family)
MKVRWLLLVILFALSGWIASDWLFLKRYMSFVVNGYDAHVAPVDWYEPVFALAHGSGSVLPVATETTLPAALVDEVLQYADEQKSMALIVIRNGKIELERYWPGYDRDSLFNPQSMSKTVLAMAAGLAIADGAIQSVDDPIGTYLEEWRDDPRGEITIRNLLNMSGGLAQIAPDYSPVPWSDAVRQHFGTDFDGPIFELALADSPGTRFDYNNNENNLLGVVIERATGQSYQDFIGERIWRAADLGPAFMYQEAPGGSVMKSCCILSRPIDWAKLGLLVLNDGRLGEQQILPPGWAREMVQPSATWSGYGYQIWRDPYDTTLGQPPTSQTWWSTEDFAAEDVVQFLGYGFQHVWVIPSLDMVVVRATRVWPDEPWDQSKIPNLLIRGMESAETSARVTWD